MKQTPGDLYPPEEVSRRMDEVVKRMLNTPPKPRAAKKPAEPPAKKGIPSTKAKPRP